MAPKTFYFKDAKTTVVYPNGGEVWQPGNTYTIKWNFDKAPDQFIGPFDTVIALDYAQGDTRIGAYTIAQNKFITNVGANQLSWTFPVGATDATGFPLQGGNFRAIVQVNKLSYQTLLKACTLPWDESDQNISLGSYAQETGTPKFTIVSPNGGENLNAGATSPINFKITGYANVTPLTLYGELRLNGNSLGHIFPGNGTIPITSVDTQITWTAGLHYGYSGTTPTQVTGSGYQLWLTIYENNLARSTDVSDTIFTISP